MIVERSFFFCEGLRACGVSIPDFAAPEICEMNRAPLALRLAALSSSVLLAGAMVWHRSRPGPALMADGNSGVTAPSAEMPHQAQQGRTLLPGSKSRTHDFEEAGFILKWLLKYTNKPTRFEKVHPAQETGKKATQEPPKVSHDYFPSNWEAWLKKE
jgi:hypothetical protein